jgi:hypothetical protein
MALLGAWEDYHAQNVLEQKLARLQAAYEAALSKAPREYLDIATAGREVDAFEPQCSFERGGADILAELQLRSAAHKDTLEKVCDQLVAEHRSGLPTCCSTRRLRT